MSVVDAAGKILIACPIGIGRGPLKRKVDMQDCITPTGEFVVDVVFCENTRQNQIDKKLKDALAANSRFAPFVRDKAGLAKIFETMNSQDFNHDGKPDHAYGYAFIGLAGQTTGPKLIAAGRSARWYSIAMHGSPVEKTAIGAATSEGCIHVAREVLKSLLDEQLIAVGTHVYINDGADVKRKSSAADNEELVRMRN